MLSSEFYYSGSAVSVYKSRMDSYILNTIEGRRNIRNSWVEANLHERPSSGTQLP